MKYEVKIGILAIVAIALAFWGFKYIQGTNLFSSSNAYYAVYDDVAGLTIGTPVQISGVAVGSVSEIQLDQQTRQVRVEMDIKDGINVPKTTKAYIVSVSVLGEKAIDLTYDKPCFGEGDCAGSGAELEGATRSILAGFLGTDGDTNPVDDVKGQLDGVVDSLQYTLFSPESDNPIARSTNDLAKTMESLKYTTGRLQNIIDANAGEISESMDNIAQITSTLASKQEALSGIIDNAEGFTQKINQLEVERTIEEINTAMVELRGTVQKANGTLDGVANVVADVQNGRGTLGKLLTSDELYDKIDGATSEADTLFSDFQERPYRYVPFKSRRKVLRQDRKDRALDNVGPKQ